MELEEMKRQWQSLDGRRDKIENGIDKEKIAGMTTARQRLVRQYRGFAILSASFIPIGSMAVSNISHNPWLTACYVAFFAAACVMDFILARKVDAIDIESMTVTEIADRAASCRRLHHIFQCILIPLMVLLLVFTVYVMTDNTAFLIGMAGGCTIGLILGLLAYFKFMDNYKPLLRRS